MADVDVRGLRETIAAFRNLPKDASNELRDATQQVSRDVAERISRAARASSRQAALMAKTVKARRDRVPVVQAGGATRVGRNRNPAYKILFGANFGARYLKQFRPWRAAGTRDYFFFSSVEDMEPEINQRWIATADTVLRRWGQ